jgi:hypothetical protein
MELALTVLLWLIIGFIALWIAVGLVQLFIILFVARKANKEFENYRKGWRRI